MVDNESLRDADNMDKISHAVALYADFLRSGLPDATGIGRLRMLCSLIERMLGVKIISKNKYKRLISSPTNGLSDGR